MVPGRVPGDRDVGCGAPALEELSFPGEHVWTCGEVVRSNSSGRTAVSPAQQALTAQGCRLGGWEAEVGQGGTTNT